MNGLRADLVPYRQQMIKEERGSPKIRKLKAATNQGCSVFTTTGCGDMQIINTEIFNQREGE